MAEGLRLLGEYASVKWVAATADELGVPETEWDLRAARLAGKRSGVPTTSAGGAARSSDGSPLPTGRDDASGLFDAEGDAPSDVGSSDYLLKFTRGATAAAGAPAPAAALKPKTKAGAVGPPSGTASIASLLKRKERSGEGEEERKHESPAKKSAAAPASKGTLLSFFKKG